MVYSLIIQRFKGKVPGSYIPLRSTIVTYVFLRPQTPLLDNLLLAQKAVNLSLSGTTAATSDRIADKYCHAKVNSSNSSLEK